MHQHCVPTFARCRTQHGRTALHAAAEKGHLEVAKVLLASGADFKATDKDGRTPLHKACERGCLAVGIMLLENKADVNAKDMVRCATRRHARGIIASSTA